jgi:hypothetical protein
MREIYKSVHKYGDLGIPLDSVIDVGDEIQCVAYGEGGTFSRDGLNLLHPDMNKYLAQLESGDTIEVFAADVSATVMYMRHHYQGKFDLMVTVKQAIFLGAFGE